jgi:hypothetical protein
VQRQIFPSGVTFLAPTGKAPEERPFEQRAPITLALASMPPVATQTVVTHPPPSTTAPGPGPAAVPAVNTTPAVNAAPRVVTNAAPRAITNAAPAPAKQQELIPTLTVNRYPMYNPAAPATKLVVSPPPCAPPAAESPWPRLAVKMIYTFKVLNFFHHQNHNVQKIT